MRYRVELTCCSKCCVGERQVLSITRHSLPMTFLATSCTFADAKATAVSAIISTCGEPKPELTLL